VCSEAGTVAGTRGRLGATGAGGGEGGLLKEHERDVLQTSKLMSLYVGRRTETSASDAMGAKGREYKDGWEAVGGLTEVVKQLREMVLLPLVYPELFQAMGVQPHTLPPPPSRCLPSSSRPQRLSLPVYTPPPPKLSEMVLLPLVAQALLSFFKGHGVKPSR